MEFSLSKEQLLIQKMAKEFGEKYIEPVADQIDRESKIPDEIMQGLAELELFGLPFKEEYGGANAGYDCYVLAMEQLAKISSGPAIAISVNCLGLGAIDKFGTTEQKNKYMPKACKGEHLASFAFTEPSTGSDPKQITTHAVKEGDYYIINGTKRFITNAGYPGPMVLFATDIESGKPTAFIVDKFCEGYTISKPWEKIGYHGGELLDVYFKDVKVPVESILGKIGGGFPVLTYGIAFGKVGVSSLALGQILSAYEESVKYAKEKTHRGAPIAKFQAIQLRIADLAMKYEACRWLTYRLGCLANDAKDPVIFAKEAALTKTFVCETSVEAARIAVDVHGSYGLMTDYKVTRLYRDAIMGPQVEGVADMQKMIIAGVVLS
ncbi:MAG: acyl-CoA dehydrogenase [Firmicutes bacterium HGW-Firmicutes-15]|nr:MAG: acyl-CoA dehydrogenase [Firmicutes bacterium HGW-Firmicutes-15]